MNASVQATTSVATLTSNKMKATATAAPMLSLIRLGPRKMPIRVGFSTLPNI